MQSTMQYKVFILVLLILQTGCKNTSNKYINSHDEDEFGDEFIAQYDSAISNLYNIAETNKFTAITIADSLIKKYEIEDTVIYDKGTVKNLHYFKGEMYYLTNDFTNALKEFSYDTIWEGNAICRASVYVKLNKPKEAYKSLLSVGKGFYLHDYVWGNYYEVIKDKDAALKIYEKIKIDKSIKHYAYYKLSVERIEALTKSTPSFLNEIYLPTGNPKFEIAESDNENRYKISKIISELPEVKDCKKCGSTWIYESPQENDKDYYWIKVGDGILENQVTQYNFFVYVKSFEIKYYDEKNNKVISLKEWRRYKR